MYTFLLCEIRLGFISAASILTCGVCYSGLISYMIKIHGKQIQSILSTSSFMFLKWFLTPVLLGLLLLLCFPLRDCALVSQVGLVSVMKLLPLFLWQLSGWLVLEVTRLSPHSDSLDVGRRESRVAAPLGVDKHKTSMLPGWQVLPRHSLRSKCGGEGRMQKVPRKDFLLHHAEFGCDSNLCKNSCK